MPNDNDGATPTKEQIEQERKDAEAAFAESAGEAAKDGAGAAATDAAGQQDQTAAGGDDGKKQAEQDTTAAGETKAAEPDPWEGVPPIVRQTLESINGKVGAVDALRREVGGFNGRMSKLTQQLTDAATQAAKDVSRAPTQAQITEAAKSSAKWEQQKADFPEWADAMEERLASERAAIVAGLPQNTAIDVDNIRNSVLNEAKQVQLEMLERARSLIRLDSKYPNWTADVLVKPGEFTAEFDTWQKTQPPEIQALVGSLNADDASKVLDRFYQHKKAAQVRLQKQQQLERAIPPRGSANQRQVTLSEREEMEKAFASVT